MKVRRILCSCLALVLVASSVSVAVGEDSLPALRRKLMFAQGDSQTGQALDALTDRIGHDGALPDHGAFGDWLGNLPSGKHLHPLVQQRRGWAYVIAKRGPEAIGPLEAALKDDPGSGLTRAYLGEALRQAGRYVDALQMLATALHAGETGQFVTESATEAALALRRGGDAKQAQTLPGYAVGLSAVLEAKPDPELHATLAQWLLSDLDAYDRPGTTRGRLWATTAARHTMQAIETSPEVLAGSATLAFDAAVAITQVDASAHGDTERFDLLAHACRLGDTLRLDGPHPVPPAFVHLAEAAAAEGRYELAYGLARRRMDMSWSPRARRLLDQLPPDIGKDE